MIKPKDVSWKDWISSRTNRFNALFVSFNATVVPLLASLDETDLQALGFSERAIVISLIGINVLAGWWNTRLRAKTSTPLSGRSHVSNHELQ